MRFLAGALIAVLSAVQGGPASGIEGERAFFPARQEERARLVINGATDLTAMQPLILDFQEMSPDVAVEFVDYVTNELFKDAGQACRENRPHGDLLLSSSVDQLVKLANDGCAAAHSSPATRSAPSWANWRDEIYGFTFEPAVMVYDGARVPPEDVPRTRDALADLLRRKPELYAGRVGTYDIEASGIGYLLAYNDSRQAPTTYGRLLESLSRAQAVTRCCNNEVLNEIVSGNILIAYNVLGSYAYAAYRNNPRLKVVVPRDYTLILSRGAMIPKGARQHELAASFIDYLLSPRGQTVAREASFFFREGHGLPPGVDGPATLTESGVGRPIRIGPGLLAAQDRNHRERFIADWGRLLARP